jgi:hypothetical protein
VKKQPCRHNRAWHFFFDGHPINSNPQWCPKCGAIRHAISSGKRDATGEFQYVPVWVRPDPTGKVNRTGKVRKKIGGGT